MAGLQVNYHAYNPLYRNKIGVDKEKEAALLQMDNSRIIKQMQGEDMLAR
jgi:hypothetical protein